MAQLRQNSITIQVEILKDQLPDVLKTLTSGFRENYLGQLKNVELRNTDIRNVDEIEVGSMANCTFEHRKRKFTVKSKSF